MKTLIFLKPFNIKSPTRDEQNDFISREIVNEVECEDLGIIYNNASLYGKDIAQFIKNKITKERPDWIVAEDQCATIALAMKRQKKVLLNPEVSFNDLNNVSEHSRQNTYGIFDAYHEQDYERFLSVYPHAVWFPEDKDLALFTIKGFVASIIKGE